jgi:ribosome recycling factor
MDEFEKSSEEKMDKSLKALEDSFKTVRTGRASAAIFDKVMVDYYGTPTPLSQTSNISIPEARLIVIQPFDKSLINEIEKAIQSSELSLNPSNDGKVIRINIPPLTEDRRKELVKQAKSMAENGKVAIRNIRRDVNETIKKSDLTDDEKKKANDNVQKITDKKIELVGKILAMKEEEIMEI